ncbi:hypothetical protein TrLO_g2067 [Triparma laevis f. longispina]|uniref:Uncharacterized protein n=1 Tax=Triparma laevis f. longispina TaxID=1714387 RepID=A0A9W7KYP5_9STRA|nr:hypothetical protein TrLO_g2067 [Triparma laevis f. longispina]
MTSQNNMSIFSTAFSDIPPESPYKSPSSLAGKNREQNYPFLSTSSLPPTPPMSQLNTPVYSPKTHTYEASSSKARPRPTGVRQASPPKYTSSGGRLVDVNFIAAAKLIDKAQSNVESARLENLQKANSISELTDLLNKSLERQTLLESRLKQMNMKLLEAYDMKNASTLEKSQAVHDCRVAKSHAIEYMKRKEEAERFVSETLSHKNLVTAQLGKSRKDLSIEKQKNAKMAQEVIDLEIKIRALTKWGDMLESSKTIAEQERDKSVKIKDDVELNAAKGRTKVAMKMQEMGERLVGLEKENETLRRRLMEVTD